MSSIESITYQLSSGLINETMIPSYYLQYQEIINLITQYKWYIQYHSIDGWTTLVKIINYSS